MQVFDVAILGAGAAGLTCAHVAASRGLSAALLDKAPAAGGKIPVSGGGKANFTNLHMGPAYFIGEQTEFCEYALDRFGPQDMVQRVQSYGIAWEERTHGQLFCLSSARGLAERLFADCERAGCVFFPNRTIQRIVPEGKHFTVETDGGPLYARRCVLALGSPAWPQAGGSDAGWRLAKQLGHRVLPARPVLTPFIMPENWPLHGLTGISLPVRVSIAGQHFEDDLLFTHRGLSGPASLKASAVWRQGETLRIDFLPHANVYTLLDARDNGKLLTRTLLSRHMPQRLADALLPEAAARRKVAELPRTLRDSLHSAVHECPVRPSGMGGLKKAEVCAGGVDTRELNPWTMESLRVPGLHIIGEMVDITGQLGGYNLHWAWASGVTAGEGITL